MSDGSKNEKSMVRVAKRRNHLVRLTPKQAQFCRRRTLYTHTAVRAAAEKRTPSALKQSPGAAYPGIRIMIVRRQIRAADEPHRQIIGGTAHWDIPCLNRPVFINGSRHHSGTMPELIRNEYQGQEYDWIFMDEATQFTERDFRFLGGCSARQTTSPKRFYLTCNRGASVTGGSRGSSRQGICNNGKTRRRMRSPRLRFIPATVRTTSTFKLISHLRADASSLPRIYGGAHRYGDWNALSGTYFPNSMLPRYGNRAGSGALDALQAFDYGST